MIGFKPAASVRFYLKYVNSSHSLELRRRYLHCPYFNSCQRANSVRHSLCVGNCYFLIPKKALHFLAFFVRVLATLLYGRAHATSAVSRGTTFRVEVLRATEPHSRTVACS